MGRSPLSVTKGLKDAVERAGGVSQLDLNDRFLLDSTLPSNMADGSLTNIGHTKIELLGQLFKKAFEVVTEDTSVMIIVNDGPTFANNLMKKMIKDDPDCQGKLVVLDVLAALHSIGRVNTKKHTLSCSDPPEEITEWMSDPKGDLLVSVQYISGIEFANIFDLAGGASAVTTRTLANVITISYNPVLDQQWAIQNILRPGHDCSTILDFSTREKVPSDITALIVDAAARQGFEISQTLPDVKGYNVMNKNPILECLVDQMDHDEQRSGEKLTGLALRDEIINALTQNTIKWPQQANKIITKEEWIRLEKKDPLFYKYQSRDAQQFEYHEAILLNLASKYLKRRITLIPFLERDQEQTFFPNSSQYDSRNNEASKASSYQLLCCT